MITVRDLVFGVDQTTSGEKRLFDRLSAEIPYGSFGILGLEGSGKSVLMRLLSGFLAPQEGVIERYVRVSFPIGYEGVFNRNLSPSENLKRFTSYYGSQISDIERCVLAKCGLPDSLGTPLGRLPPEIQTRFVFAATYILPFDCYLVDERFCPSDPDFRAVCAEMLEARVQQGNVIIASKRPHLIQRFCKKAGILVNGKLRAYDDVEQAVSDFRLISEEANRRRLSTTLSEAAR